MTSFHQAIRLILARADPLGTESVPLRKLTHRVLAQPLISPFDVPHFDNSQVDGYAVFSGDSGLRRVVGESAAGGSVTLALGPGEAIRIFTGAPMPVGADAVAMQEDVRLEDGLVLLEQGVRPGENVRLRGEEIAAGVGFDVAGRFATPPVIGLAASFGLTEVAAYRVPRVAIVATGSELVPPGAPLPPGGVYASNPEALAAALAPLGIVASTRLVGDDPAATRDVLAQALEEADILITVGGVSVGDHDLVRPTLAALGVEEVFWRVDIKPGKPFYFGRKGAKLVFGLPGNPVSALITFSLLVHPALLAMLGMCESDGASPKAELGETIERRDLRHEFVRATLAHGMATPVFGQGSHMQTGLAFADALIEVPSGVARIEKGETVTVIPLPWR